MAANGILEFQGTEKAIFRGSNSNIVIDTANSSFGVGVDTPTSNLHIVGKTSLQGDLNLVQVSNVANVTVNSNVVTEYTGPHDRPLRKYPEVAIPASQPVSGTGPYTYAGYTIKVSSVLGDGANSQHRPTNVFDTLTNVNGWLSKIDSYSGTDGTALNATDPDQDFQSIKGSWIDIKLPHKIKLNKITIRNRDSTDLRNPKTGILWASNNDSDWERIQDFSGLLNIQNHVNTVFVNETIAYNQYRLQITEMYTFATNPAVAIGEWELYGYEEGSGSLDTTLKSVYNVPATTGTQLEVYYDGQDFSGTPTSITDRSPNTITATANNITIDTTYKSFEITSSPRSNIIADNVTFASGDEAHTYALWVRLKNSQQRNLLIDYRPDGGTNTTGNAAGILIDDYNQRIQFFHQAADVETRYTFTTNVWYHIICSYLGGGNNTTTSKIYINGVEQTNTYVPSGNSTSTLTLPTTGKLTIGDFLYGGNYSMGDGNIGNVRLYSKALNADQVKELYDYQKDYFLGSKSQLTIYKGHLGVGVTEPSGQLELAGDERLQEYPPGPMDDYETLIPGHGAFVALGGNSSSYAPWKAFDKSTSTFWIDTGVNYSTTSPYGPLSTAPKTTLYDGSTLIGGWIDLECPYPIKLKKVGTAPRANYSSIGLQRGVILGSDNGVDWYQVDTIDYAGTTPPNSLTYFDINTDSYYSHFRLVCTNLTALYAPNGNPDMHWQMSELVYFGTPGPTTLDKGSLSLTRSLDVPRISRYDVDTETPRPEKLVVDFDTTVNSSPTDISGQGNHGTFYNGASYSPADKAFTFVPGTNGTNNGDHIQVTLNNTSGEWAHSLSVWIKLDDANANGVALMGIGETTGRKNSVLYLYAGTSATTRELQYSNHNTDSLIVPNGNVNFVPGRWYHIVLTTNAGTISSSNQKMYVDGVEQPTTVTGTASNLTLNLDANDNLFIGRQSEGYAGNWFDGLMSNYKIYNVALEPSEVRKLYNLGRTGRSMVISDTAVGIGKVPEAQLDVRGVARLERLLINGTLGHVLLEEAEIYYDPSRAECQDRTEFMNNTVRDIKGNYHGTKTGISEYNQFWGQDADNSGIATNNNIDLRRDWTAMIWMKPAADDNLGIWKILGHGTTTSNGGLHFQGADGSRIRAGMYGNDIDVGTATGMSRRREWNCMTFAYYHNNGVAGGCDKMIYQNERLVGHQQGGIGDGYHFTGNNGGSGASNGHQPYSASPNILRFGAGFSSGTHGKQYQHIGPCIFIPRFLSTQEVRSLYRFFAMRFARVGADS